VLSFLQPAASVGVGVGVAWAAVRRAPIDAKMGMKAAIEGALGGRPDRTL
jgi:hypothetical protein